MRRIFSSAGIALLVTGVLSVPAAQGPADPAVPAMTQQSLTQQSLAQQSVVQRSLVQQSVECSGVNGADVSIPDGSTGAVVSAVTISGCAGNAVAASTVEVHVVHPYIGDLIVDLIAPDASVYSLHWRAGGDSNNIDQTYTVNLAGEVAAGTWKLRVQDMATGDTGFINSWTLNLVGGGVAGDFSLAVSPASGSTTPGGAVTTTVSTALINGGSQSINLTASGLPAGTTAAFTPSPVTLGGSSTLTIATTSATAGGVYLVTITGTGASSLIRTTTYRLTVSLPAVACTRTNSADVAVADNTTTHSLITIAGCVGKAGAGSTVEVHLVHTHIDDLIVDLVAPDGSVYGLHHRTGGGTANIDHTYTVDLAGELANGTWKLRVHDAEGGDTGSIDAWTLNVTGTGPQPEACTRTNHLAVTIPDTNTAVDSPITIAGCTGNAATTATIEVHIGHTYIGDLTVDLIAPDGSIYHLHQRTGSSTSNIDHTYTINLASEPANGTWKLRAHDTETADTGHITTWTLKLAS